MLYKKIIFLVFLFLFLLFVYDVNGSDNVFCVKNDFYNKKDLGLVFISDEDCYGYVLKKYHDVWYRSYNSGVRGKIEIYFGDDSVEWLKGRRIELKEDERAFNYRQHFTNLMMGYSEGRESIFDDNLGLVAYVQRYNMSRVEIRHIFDVGENTDLPFYIYCFYRSANSDLNDVNCAISFAYNSTVSVYVIVDYLELNDAKFKVRELKNIIEKLLS